MRNGTSPSFCFFLPRSPQNTQEANRILWEFISTEREERERASVRSRKSHTRRGPPKTLYELVLLRLVPTTLETCVFAGFLTDLVPPTNFSKVVLFLYVKTLWMHEQHVINCESDCFFGIGRSSVIIYFLVGPAIHLTWSFPIPSVSLCCVFGHSYMGQILNNPCTYFWLMCKFFKRVFLVKLAPQWTVPTVSQSTVELVIGTRIRFALQSVDAPQGSDFLELASLI